MTARMDPPRPHASLYRRLRRIRLVRTALFLLGCVLMAIAPIIGILPGPGFIIIFPIGLALALQNSLWAKRTYGRFKRRYPAFADRADRFMRRPSALRRAARRKRPADAGQ